MLAAIAESERCLSTFNGEGAYGNEASEQAHAGQQLVLAGRVGDDDMVKALLTRSDTKVFLDQQDESGSSALMYAASNGRIEAVRVLLAKGANPNMQNRGGATALIWASYNNQYDVAKFLLEHGADPNLQAVDGFTALMAAGSNGRTRIAKLPLEHGADPRLQTIQGGTALTLAVDCCHRELADVLRQAVKQKASDAGKPWTERADDKDHDRERGRGREG